MTYTDRPSSYMGMNVVLVQPHKMTTKRQWKERLFTWPWKPLQKTKIEYVRIIKANEVFVVGNDIMCSPEAYDAIKKGTYNLK